MNLSVTYVTVTKLPPLGLGGESSKLRGQRGDGDNLLFPMPELFTRHFWFTRYLLIDDDISSLRLRLHRGRGRRERKEGFIEITAMSAT